MRPCAAWRYERRYITQFSSVKPRPRREACVTGTLTQWSIFVTPVSTLLAALVRPRGRHTRRRTSYSIMDSSPSPPRFSRSGRSRERVFVSSLYLFLSLSVHRSSEASTKTMTHFGDTLYVYGLIISKNFTKARGSRPSRLIYLSLSSLFAFL